MGLGQLAGLGTRWFMPTRAVPTPPDSDPFSDDDRFFGFAPPDPFADDDQFFGLTPQQPAPQPAPSLQRDEPYGPPTPPPSFDLGVGPVSTLDRFGYQPKVQLQQPPQPVRPPAATLGEAAARVGETAKAIGGSLYDRARAAITGEEPTPPAAPSAPPAPETWLQKLDAFRKANEATAIGLMTTPGSAPPPNEKKMRAGMKSMHGGFGQLTDGLATGDDTRTQRGAIDVVNGFFQTAEPAIVGAMVAAPVATLVAAGSAMLADKAAYEAIKAAGGSEETAELGGLVASVAAGYGGVKAYGKAGAFVNEVRAGRGKGIFAPFVEPPPTVIDPLASDIVSTAVPEPTGLVPRAPGAPSPRGAAPIPEPPVPPVAAAPPETFTPPPPPTVADGMVRLYNGGAEEGRGPRWFTSDPNYAKFQAETGGGTVTAIELPVDHPALADKGPQLAQGRHVNVQLAAEDLAPPVTPRAEVARPTSAPPVAEPPAVVEPPAAAPHVLSDETRGRHELTLPDGKGTIDLIDPARAAAHAEARGADPQVVDDWRALPENHLYVDTAQVKTPRQGDGTKLYKAALDFAERRGYAGLASKAEGRTPAADALWASLGRQGLATRVGDFDVVTIEPQGRGAPHGRETDYRGPGSDTRAAAPAVSAPAGEHGTGAAAPAPHAYIAQVEAIANAIGAHPRFKDFRVEATPDGHFAVHGPTGPPVVAQILKPSAFPSSFDNDHTVASFVAEAQASGTTHYSMGGGNRVSRHPLPTTLAAFNALPKGHQDKLRARFVVAGRYNPDTDTLHISEDWALDPDVWAEEHFHAGVARMTPEEKKAARVETKAQEEAAFREGWQVPPEIYSRPRGNLGTLGNEGQPHDGQETQAGADAGAPGRERPDGALQEVEGSRADARGDGGSGARVYGTRERTPRSASALTDDTIREAVGADFARLLASILDPDGGFTYSPISGSPTAGFALSVTKAAEATYAPPDISPRTLADYIRQHKDALSDSRNYIGAWHNPDDGKAYLDISTVVKTRDEAERLGLEHDQLAYYDLAQGRSIKRDDWDAVRRAGPVVPRLNEPSYAVRESTVKQRPRTERAPFQWEDEHLVISGRVPKGPDAPPRESYLTARLAALSEPEVSAERRQAYADYARALPVLTKADLRETRRKDSAVIERAVERMVTNLRWLWNLFPDDVRERAKEWYRGAHRIAEDIATTEGITRQQAAGVLAALSPQMDWFKNVDLARRTVSLYNRLSKTNAVFDKRLFSRYAADAKAKAVKSRDTIARRSAKEGKAFDGEAYLARKLAQYTRERKLFAGKSWSELDDTGRALMLRTVDEAENPRHYHVITPEGAKGDLSRNKGGDPAQVGWGNYGAIATALSILRDGSHANIDLQLGEEHKIRSFFNNIENPESPDFVTVDTHAVAAALLLPLAGEDPYVRSTLGGAPSVLPAGLSGTNVIIAEPYFRLAQQLSDELGRTVLPREVQSVTWEAIRGLFKPEQKRGAQGEALRLFIDGLAVQHARGTITTDDYHAAVERAAGGVRLPDWHDAPHGAPADEGGVPEADVHGRRADVPAGRGGRVGSAEGTGRRPAGEYRAALPRSVPDRAESVAPSYGVRDTALTLDRLQREATAQGVSLADAVEQARADGRDIDVSDYFNLKRVELPDEEQQALTDQIIDTIVATGRVPKERLSHADIRAEAQQLGGNDLAKQLDPFLQQQAPFRAVRDAARHRINELSREIYDETKALAALPVEQKAEREAAEQQIAEKTETVQTLLSTWMKIRSEDGRNLAMHGMMSDSIGWQWGDKAYWYARAKRELGLPQNVELPPDVLTKVNDILERGAEAQAEAEGAPPDAATGTTDAAPPVQGPDLPPRDTRGPMTRRPPVQGPVLPPVPSRGPMTQRPPVQGPVVPPTESRGPMSRPAPVEGPVLPPAESRGPMTRRPAVQGPVLPPVESRGPMSRKPPVEGPVLPPTEGQGSLFGEQRTSGPRGPAPFRLTPPPGDPKPSSKMHGPPLSYPERRGKKPTAKETAVQLELADYLTGLKKTDWFDAFLLLRKAGFLTGIPTHVRNFVGNLGFQAQEEVARIPAALTDMLISLGTGTRTVQGASPLAVARASLAAATDGVREAAQVMRGGTLTAAEKLKTGAHRELNTGVRWLDAYANFVFRSLSASDRIFKSYAFRRSLEAQAAVAAKNSKGATTADALLAKPSEAMLARALSDAEFATFNNPNVASSMWQQGVGAGKRGGLTGKTLAAAADIVVPFTNTPANIFERVLDGAGVTALPRMAVAAYRGARSGAPPPPKPPKGGTTAAAGAPDEGGSWLRKPKKVSPNKASAAALAKQALSPSQQEVFSMAFGRGFAGGALMLLGYWLAQKGLATGVSDEEEGTRNVKEAAGRQPGSIKVGDKWRQVGGFSPYGNLIVLGASMQERGASPSKLAIAAGKTVMEQPMLAGAKEAVEGIQKIDTAGERFVTNTIGGTVPSMLSNLAASFDPYRRETKPEGDVLTRGTQARTPGARNQLPARTDIFGEPMREAAGRMYDPTTPVKDKSDDVTRALMRLHVGIGKPDKVAPDLETPAAYRERVAETGKAIRLALEEAVAAPDFDTLDDDEQAARLERAIALGRSQHPRPKPARAGGG